MEGESGEVGAWGEKRNRVKKKAKKKMGAFYMLNRIPSYLPPPEPKRWHCQGVNKKINFETWVQSHSKSPPPC